VQCILPQGQTTPERILSNPWYDKGFCEPNQYKAAIDRCKGGYESCELFIDIFSERARIERNYIAELEKWSATSIKDISQSKEYGTNKKAWMDSIRASKEIANTHSDIVQRLQENVIDKMVDYKKQNYGKSILHIKKIKEFERDFEQAQKSWIKLLDKINRAKKDYQEAHRQLKKAETAEKIIDSDRGAEEEQKTKVKLSVSTYKKEFESLRSKYQQHIEEMKNSRPNYENSMKEVLDRTHAFERKRLAQFKASFTTLHQALLIDKDSHLNEMTESFNKAIASHDIEKDIQWWNSHFGSDTNTAWPSFEELKN
jgi:chromosome segregation ATPase